jgi:hypothetical protein
VTPPEDQSSGAGITRNRQVVMNGRKNNTRCVSRASVAEARRFQRNVAKVYGLGPRMIHELLLELGTAIGRPGKIQAVVARYAAFAPVPAAPDRWQPSPGECGGRPPCSTRAR